MFEFVLVNIIFLSLGTLLFLMARALPRLEEDGARAEKQTMLDRWVTSELPERIDIILNAFLAKLLRKGKVAILKIDNIFTAWLHKVRKDNGRETSISDHLKELAGNGDDGQGENHGGS